MRTISRYGASQQSSSTVARSAAYCRMTSPCRRRSPSLSHRRTKRRRFSAMKKFRRLPCLYDPFHWRTISPRIWAETHRNEGCISCRSEEHTSELQSLMRISYAVFCLKKKTKTNVVQLHTDR